MKDYKNDLKKFSFIECKEFIELRELLGDCI